MRATVQQSDYRVGRSSDQELQTLVNQQRSALNAVSQEGPFTLTTAATAAWSTVWTSDGLSLNTAREVNAVVSGVSSDHTQAALYDLRALFLRASGAVAQVGVTAVLPGIESQAAFSARIVVSGGGVAVDVIDDGVYTMNWSALIYSREIR